METAHVNWTNNKFVEARSFGQCGYGPFWQIDYLIIYSIDSSSYRIKETVSLPDYSAAMSVSVQVHTRGEWGVGWRRSVSHLKESVQNLSFKINQAAPRGRCDFSITFFNGVIGITGGIVATLEMLRDERLRSNELAFDGNNGWCPGLLA